MRSDERGQDWLPLPMRGHRGYFIFILANDRRRRWRLCDANESHDYGADYNI